MASQINDAGARVFTCGASTINIDSAGSLSISVRGATLTLNLDEINDAIAVLQYSQGYISTKGVVPAVAPALPAAPVAP